MLTQLKIWSGLRFGDFWVQVHPVFITHRYLEETSCITLEPNQYYCILLEILD